MRELNIADLKIVKEFQHVPDDQLQWLVSQGETVIIEKDEPLSCAGIFLPQEMYVPAL